MKAEYCSQAPNIICSLMNYSEQGSEIKETWNPPVLLKKLIMLQSLVLLRTTINSMRSWMQCGISFITKKKKKAIEGHVRACFLSRLKKIDLF